MKAFEFFRPVLEPFVWDHRNRSIGRRRRETKRVHGTVKIVRKGHRCFVVFCHLTFTDKREIPRHSKNGYFWNFFMDNFTILFIFFEQFISV